MTSKELRLNRRYLHEENKKWPAQLKPVPREDWPTGARFTCTRINLLRSKEFAVQVIQEANGVVRLTVNRSELDNEGGWKEGITWDELQRLKNEAGYGAQQAVEIYPPESDVVNVANMRHLWILPEPLPFAWKTAPVV